MILGKGVDCCGCTACVNVCQTHAITMTPNHKGFLEPTIDEQLCVKCDLCDRVCPIENKKIKELEWQQQYFAAKVQDKTARSESQSGGAFAAIAKHVLHNGGIVYGVSLNKQLEAEYCRIDNIKKLGKLYGSKYVQANVKTTYFQAADDLLNGKSVLFSGTPCHIQGLNNYLKQKKINTDKLLTVDLVCHGVPSPRVYEDYKKWTEKRHSAKVGGFNFRSKRFGWHGHIIIIIIGGKKFVNNDYVKFFYSHLGLRDSCYECTFTNLNRPGDITIGDCWGIEKFAPEFDDNKGCSLVITNTPKGYDTWSQIHDKFEYLEAKRDQILQPNLQHPTERPKLTDEFWADYEKYGCEYALCRYCVCDPDKEYEIIDSNQYFRRGELKLKRVYHRIFG